MIAVRHSLFLRHQSSTTQTPSFHHAKQHRQGVNHPTSFTFYLKVHLSCNMRAFHHYLTGFALLGVACFFSTSLAFVSDTTSKRSLPRATTTPKAAATPLDNFLLRASSSPSPFLPTLASRHANYRSSSSSQLHMSDSTSTTSSDNIPPQGSSTGKKKGILGRMASVVPPAAERQKLVPLGLMFFCILFNYTILRDTKDVLMVR